MKLVWTEPALRDMAAARAYVASDNPQAAGKQMERVLATVTALLQFPEMGRIGRRVGTREMVIGQTPYIAAYRLRGDAIEILRVMHGRQRWPDSL